MNRLVSQRRKILDQFSSTTLGVVLSMVIALAATYTAGRYGGPTMLYALLFGIALNDLAETPKAIVGVNFCAKRLLRIGVALLGMRLTIAEIGALGAETIVLVVCGIGITFALGILVGRILGLSSTLSVLSSGAVAICGASAALAISSVLPRDKLLEQRTIVVVVGVTSLSTIAMMIYPIVVGFAGLDDVASGIFIGATIHDVAQVVGAGYTISQDAGDAAAIVKLLRVAFLLPVVMIIGLVFGSKSTGGDGRSELVPLFLLAFLVFLLINSFELLPVAIADGLRLISSGCLISAVAALGLRTSLRKLMSVGPSALVAMVVQSLVLALFALLFLKFV